MRKKAGEVVLILLLLWNLAAGGAAAVGISPKDFPCMSELQLTAHYHSFFVLHIPPAAAGTMSSSLGDLRIFAGQHELGYAVLPLGSGYQAPPEKMQKLEIINSGALGSDTYSFTVHTGSFSRDRMLKVELGHDPYLVKGVMYGSNDNRTWQELKPVTLFSIDNRTNDISLLGIDYDYLKIELVQPPGEVLEVREAWLVFPGEFRGRDMSSLEQATFAINRDGINKESILTADLKHPNRLSSQWFLETEEKGFYRQLIMEGSNTGSDWRFIASTYIYRGINPGDEKLSFDYGPAGYRYLRLRIMDDDNNPIEIKSLKVRIYPVRVLVKLPPSLEEMPLDIAAYWGNKEIKAPSYDVGELLGSLDIEAYPAFSLGDAVQNPHYREAESQVPFSERYSFLLPFGLAAAAIIIALLLYRNVKQISS